MNTAPQSRSQGEMWRWLWRLSWLPTALRRVAYKKLNAAGQAPDAPFEIDFYGLRYRGNLSNGIEFAMYHYGAFEKPLLYFLRDALRAIQETHEAREREAIFLDIGANIGQHSLFMSLYADRVHAFEPYHAVANSLREHIRLNAIDNIVVHELGLSDNNGTLPFYAPVGSNKGVGSFDSRSQQRGNRCVGELMIRRGDDFLAANDIPLVDLIKIDVEGYERRALLGMRRMLENSRPVIVCEISYGQPHSFRSKKDLLACLPKDYRLLRFDTRKSNGKAARRRGARAKRTGEYQLLPLTTWRERDQDDLVAVPAELVSVIPRQNTTGIDT